MGYRGGNTTLAASAKDVTATAAELSALHGHSPAMVDSANTWSDNQTVNGDLTINSKLKIKTGTNATVGSFTETTASGTYTVYTNKVTANSIILLSLKGEGEVPTVSSINSGVSFSIAFYGPPEQVIAWLIIEPA